MEISRKDKLEQMEKILRGRSLQGSESLKGFLRFVVDMSVENQEGRLKEYVIATEVFGRSSDFDSKIDSVVRVQAGRLRAKLQEYYASEGLQDPIIIDLPKGQYIPVFSLASERRVAEEASSAVNGAAEAPAVVTTEGGTETQSSFWRYATAILAIGLLAVSIYAISLRSSRPELGRSLALGPDGSDESIDRTEVEALWGSILNSTDAVLVVFSNTLFEGTAEDGMKLLKSLDSPGSSVGSPIMPQSEIETTRKPISEHYTGIGEVTGAYLLGDFMARVGQKSRIKRSLLLNWDDLKAENIIVLGSPAENLFLRDLPQKQEFVFRPNLINQTDNGKKAYGIVNTRPRQGEATQYFAAQGGPSRSQITEDYAVVSLIEGLNSKNRLLILAGITTMGTQAAAEYVTRPAYIKDMVRRLNISPAGAKPKLPSGYQVLIRVKVNGGVPVQITYVTHHVLD